MRLSLAGIWMLLTIYGFADTYVRQPSIDVIHYDIALELTDASDSITGSAKVHVRMRTEPVSSMWLDFEDMIIDKFLVGGVERAFKYQNGRLAFEFGRAYSRNQVAKIEVRYHGKPREGLLHGKNMYGRKVIFADNWPDNARHWFPSIDHPSDKATVDFAVTAPEKYDVVANGIMAKSRLLADGRKRTRWNETKAIPTYCMTIGIAEFSVTRGEYKTGVPLAWYVYPEDSRAAALKFGRTAQILDYFVNLIGPYPYEKLAQVESIIPMGAMENSSAIFYSESSFLGEPVSEEPVAHEIAHQWFGDSVTEADWDHLWLSEGFATYFEALYYEHLKGPESLKQIMDRYAKRIRDYPPATWKPIVDPQEKNPAKKLNPINYEKGAWVLHMLRRLLGEEVFFRGIRRYYELYTGGNTVSKDFETVMESVSGTDLDGFFRQWLYQPGWPEYRVSWQWIESAGELEISISQLQTTGLYDLPIEFVVSGENLQEVYQRRVSAAASLFRIPFRTRPSAVELDPKGWVLKSVVSPAGQ
jgi:aminopeptidase N